MSMVERVGRAVREQISHGNDHELDLGRAALEAMREPTDAMLDACYDGETIGAIKGHALPTDDIRVLFATMIDEALK